jgi:hypothetical protein
MTTPTRFGFIPLENIEAEMNIATRRAKEKFECSIAGILSREAGHDMGILSWHILDGRLTFDFAQIPYVDNSGCYTIPLSEDEYTMDEAFWKIRLAKLLSEGEEQNRKLYEEDKLAKFQENMIALKVLKRIVEDFEKSF